MLFGIIYTAYRLHATPLPPPPLVSTPLTSQKQTSRAWYLLLWRGGVVGRSILVEVGSSDVTKGVLGGPALALNAVTSHLTVVLTIPALPITLFIAAHGPPIWTHDVGEVLKSALMCRCTCRLYCSSLMGIVLLESLPKKTQQAKKEFHVSLQVVPLCSYSLA